MNNENYDSREKGGAGKQVVYLFSTLQCPLFHLINKEVMIYSSVRNCLVRFLMDNVSAYLAKICLACDSV
jgi:hypothetical protein